MKNKLLSLLMILIPGTFMQASGQDEMQYLFYGKGSKFKLSGFAGPFVEFSAVDKEFAVCVGGGGASNCNNSDKVFVFIPQVEAEPNLLRWLNVSTGVGYRLVNGIDKRFLTLAKGSLKPEPVHDKTDFNSFMVSHFCLWLV